MILPLRLKTTLLPEHRTGCRMYLPVVLLSISPHATALALVANADRLETVGRVQDRGGNY